MGLKHSEIMDKLLKLQGIDYALSTQGINDLLKTTTNLTAGVSYLDSDNLNTIIAELTEKLSEYKIAISSFETRLRAVLNNSVDDYLKDSENIWSENIEKMTFEENKEWSKMWPPVLEEYDNFLQFCATLCTWQLPGLILGAKDRPDITKTVSGTDPMYMVEQYPQYFDEHKKRITPEQARKIRFYRMDELSLLPKNSIGIIVVYNEFPFLPWSVTTTILHLLTQLLSPGGTIVFNYNNCMTYKGFLQFEKRLMVYTTPEMFKNQCKKFGLTCTHNYVSPIQAFSYMAFQKEGDKNLSKRHASLGYIRQHKTLEFLGIEKQQEQAIKHEQRIEYIRRIMSSK